MKTNHANESLTEARIRKLLLCPKDLTRLEFLPFDELRPASVLIPIYFDERDWRLLFTKRTERVNDHKGQVSFPGGASEAGDTSPEVTALREAQEEIGINPGDVTILGRLPTQPTISKYLITPIVGKIPCPYEFKLSSEEVERVFSIPLSWLAAPDHFEERPYLSSDGNVHSVIFFKRYDGEVLWGITARMTVILLKTLNLLHN